MPAAAAPAVDALRDIRGPVAVPWDLFWPTVIIACLAVLVAAWWLRRYLRRREVAPIDPVRPPWEVALEAIDAIARGEAMRQADFKEFYSQLSGIVRWYIEERFRLRAPEMTTEEFMDAAGRSPELLPEQRDFLRGFLEVCDMVKFARQVPAASDMAAALLAARRFVENTRP